MTILGHHELKNRKAETCCSKFKEWLYLTFLPQEDSAQLNVLRSMLTPFLKAMTRALSIELEKGYLEKEERKAIFDEIMRNLPTENSTSNFSANLSRASGTLHDEFDQLRRMNIQ